MATQTTNYGLKKPLYTDAADISVINENMDAIDAKIKEIEDKAGSGGGGGGGLSVGKTVLLENIVPSVGVTLQYSQQIQEFDCISVTTHDGVGNSTCLWIPKENYGNTFAIQTWISNNGYVAFCPATGEVAAANNCTIDTIIGYKFS